MELSIRNLIEAKRDGQTLTDGDVERLVTGIVDGSVPDLELGALLMALQWQGAELEETIAWTRAMRDSGRVLSFEGMDRPLVDKHSTGGVGDKVTLVLAPLAAALGMAMPTMTGRSLGHTGGTIDKLLAMPGLRVDLNESEVRSGLEHEGFAFFEAGPEFAPADRRVYAARDRTGTVPCLPMIVASILSKKLSSGTEALVLDVKVGRGAFMRSKELAHELGEALVEVATRLGCPTRYRLGGMDQPLGRAVGSSLEFLEALACLQGGGPPDLRAHIIELAADMLELSGLSEGRIRDRARAGTALDKGEVLALFRAGLIRQGALPAAVHDPVEALPRAPIVQKMLLEDHDEGLIIDLDPMLVAQAAMSLGSPRDPAVGVECLAKPGEVRSKGEPIFRIHGCSRREVAAATRLLIQAIKIDVI